MFLKLNLLKSFCFNETGTSSPHPLPPTLTTLFLIVPDACRAKLCTASEAASVEPVMPLKMTAEAL